mgnify:CR=1 FL=1
MNLKRLFLATISGMLINSSCTHAQEYSYNLKFTVSRKNFVDSIPIEFNNGKIIIKAYSGGKIYRFFLDTGSSQGVLYRNGSLRHIRERGIITSHDANGNSNKIMAVEFPTFKIGSLEISGYCGSQLTLQPNSDDHDAIIGFDLFNKGLLAKIDVASGYMILTDNRHYFDNEYGYEMKYRLLRWVPNVKLSPFIKCTDEARFDTGSRRLYEMGNRSCGIFMKEMSEFSSQIESETHGSRTIASFGTERNATMYFLHLDRLMMGGFSFLDYHTITTQGNSRIGSELLNYGSVIINPYRKLIIFCPYEDNGYLDISNKQTDIAFVPSSNGKACVGMIWEGSPHYQNGFRQGDTILSVNGTTIESFNTFLTYPFIQGYTYTFVVVGNDGTIRTIQSER